MRVLRPRKGSGNASVTVVVPCYNYGHFLPEVTRSILSQRNVQVKVIIVDDASTDDSAQVAFRLAHEDARVEVVLHEQNQGHIGTYNDGLGRVTTAYAALLSADDLLTPGALSRATSLMDHQPSVGMVYGRPLAFTDKDGPPALPSDPGASWTVWSGLEWIHWAARRGRCFILSPEVVVRTEAMESVGLYNPELPHSGDLEYWLRIAARWDVGRVNGPVQAMYRVHGENMHIVSYGSLAIDLRHRLKAFAVLQSRIGKLEARTTSRLWRQACRAVSREAFILAERELDSGGLLATAATLLDVALEANPKADQTGRHVAILRRLKGAAAKDGPRLSHRTREAVRNQINRVRWRVWDAVGIS